MLPHAYKLSKMSVHDCLSEICISESTPPRVTKQTSPFRRPLLRRKGAQLNITSHFPTPLESDHSYDFVDQRTSSSGGGNSAAALQLSSGSTIPFSSIPPPLDCRRIFGGSPAEKGIVLPELSCRAAAEFPPPVLLVRWSTKS